CRAPGSLTRVSMPGSRIFANAGGVPGRGALPAPLWTPSLRPSTASAGAGPGCAAVCRAVLAISRLSSGKVRHDIRYEKFAGLYVVPKIAIAVDQQVDACVAVLPNDIDGLGHGTDKAAQRSAGGEVRTLPRYRGRIVGKRPALDMGFFDRVVVPIYRVAMPAQHSQLTPCFCNIAADQIARVSKTGDRT